MTLAQVALIAGLPLLLVCDDARHIVGSILTLLGGLLILLG